MSNEREFLKQKWYLSGPPWFNSRDCGLTVLIGDEDPHKASHQFDVPSGFFSLMIEAQELSESISGTEEVSRAFAQHIVALHNAGMDEQSEKQIKADGINEFVCSMIDALETGFLDENSATLAEIHRVMQNFCKDRYGVELPHISEQWGEETARLCGHKLPAPPEGEL